MRDTNIYNMFDNDFYNDIRNSILNEDVMNIIDDYNTPDDYTVDEVFTGDGACIAHDEDDERYLIIGDTIYPILDNNEYNTILNMFYSSDSYVFRYNNYPTYVFCADNRYYVKHDESIPLLEICMSDNQ